MPSKLSHIASACLALLCTLASPFAQAQSSPAAPESATARPTAEPGSLRSSNALFLMDYQSVKVRADLPIDLMGFHFYHQVADGLYAGGGFSAPVFQGAYGGFLAADVGVHARHRLAGPLFGIAGVSVGGGGGGRSVEQSKVLSGSGGFAKAYVGLGWDFGPVTVGATVTRMKFKRAAIDGAQASAFLEIPFSYLTGPYVGQGTPLSPADDRRAAQQMGESMLTLTLDNYHQVDPQGSNKTTIGLADLQFAHYFAADAYWFAALGMGYRGLPLYNQLLGGVGERLRVSRGVTLYGQLGIGSGGYSPDRIDTGSGLLVYPKVAAEYAITRDLGVSLSAGYMTAPRGSSRNVTYGLALTRHLRSGGADAAGSATWQGVRVSMFQQTEFDLRYRDIGHTPLQMLGLQVDLPIDARWYVPVQATGAYTAYLGYPGYAELLTGVGLQTKADEGDHWQAFGQLMAGANVHGKTGKASVGVRYLLDDRLALDLSAGHVAARSATGGHFTANSASLGFDYRFSIPTR